MTVPASSADAAAPTPAARTLTPPRRRRLMAALLGVGWALLGVVAVISVGGLLVRVAAQLLTLVPRAIVWLALAAQDGADWWSIAGRAGTAMAAAVGSSQVIWWVIGLELLGVAALAGLQAMLRDETGRDSEEDDK